LKVIIPAAGHGSRLRPYTYTVPKSLLPVAGKAILGFIVDQALEWGADQITIIYGYLREQVKTYLDDNYRIPIDYRLQEKPLGLGQAVYLGLDPGDRETVVILGDTIVEADLTAVISAGRTALGVKKVADPRKFGVAVLQDGRVTRLIEKPVEAVSNQALVGLYYFRDGNTLRAALENTMQRGSGVKNEFQLTDALQMLVEAGEDLQVFTVSEWFDCGTPDALIDCNQYLLSRNGSAIRSPHTDDSVLIPPLFIGAGSEIIRSVVGPFVSIGSKTCVKDSVLRNSIIGDQARIQDVTLSRAVLGNRTELTGRPLEVRLGASTGLKL